jgi:hypothetical protein
MAKTKQTARKASERPDRAVRADDQRSLDKLVDKECEVCLKEGKPSQLYNKAGLKRHRAEDHPDYQLAYKCPICEQMSRRREQIAKHMLSRHGIRLTDKSHKIDEIMLTKKALARSCLKKGGPKKPASEAAVSDSNESEASVSKRTRHRSKKGKVSQKPDVSSVQESCHLSSGSSSTSGSSDDDSSTNDESSLAEIADSADEFEPKPGGSKSKPKKEVGAKVPKTPKVALKLKLNRPGKAAAKAEPVDLGDDLEMITDEEAMTEGSLGNETLDYDLEELGAVGDSEDQTDPSLNPSNT